MEIEQSPRGCILCRRTIFRDSMCPECTERLQSAKIAFISGPYRGEHPADIVENIRRAEECAKKYWKLGYTVICPHLNTMLFDGILPDEVWLWGDYAILARCDIVVMMQNWKMSSGATREHDLAIKLGKDIIYEAES